MGLLKPFPGSHMWCVLQLRAASRWDKAPFTRLISLGRRLPWPEGIHAITWPGSWFWQLGVWYHALFLPDSLSVTFTSNKGIFHLRSKFENSACLKHYSFPLSYTSLCFYGNRNENLLAACRQAADDSSQYQISAVDFQTVVPRTHCNNKHKGCTILAPPVLTS